MRRLALLGLLAAGCQPALASDYVCARLECPPGWTCWADGRCRDHAPEYGIAQGCDSDDECSTFLCATGLDPTTTSGRYCSEACASDEGCADFPGMGASCVEGACRAKCERDTDCPEGTGTECRVGIPAGDDLLPTGAFCFHLMRDDLDGRRSCDGNAETSNACQRPGWCVQLGDGSTTDIGLCSMICETRPMTQNCPMGSECAPLVAGFGQCMQPCPGGDGDCTDAGLTCLTHTNGNPYCMPASWAGIPLPLSGGLPDLVGIAGP